MSFWSKLGSFAKKSFGFDATSSDGKFQWSDLLNPGSTFNALTGVDVGGFLKDTVSNVAGVLSGSNQKQNQALQQAAIAEQQKYNTSSAQAAMDFSAEQAQIAREWDLQVNSPSFKMQQLKEAGINPVLGLGMLGSNYTSSSPQGVMASSSNAEVDTQNQLLELGSLIGAGMLAFQVFGAKKFNLRGFG